MLSIKKIVIQFKRRKFVFTRLNIFVKNDNIIHFLNVINVNQLK